MLASREDRGRPRRRSLGLASREACPQATYSDALGAVYVFATSPSSFLPFSGRHATGTSTRKFSAVDGSFSSRASSGSCRGSLDCFYCMGHTETKLEVAGLDRNAVTEQARLLAGADWLLFSSSPARCFRLLRGSCRKAHGRSRRTMSGA